MKPLVMLLALLAGHAQSADLMRLKGNSDHVQVYDSSGLTNNAILEGYVARISPPPTMEGDRIFGLWTANALNHVNYPRNDFLIPLSAIPGNAHGEVSFMFAADNNCPTYSGKMEMVRLGTRGSSNNNPRYLTVYINNACTPDVEVNWTDKNGIDQSTQFVLSSTILDGLTHTPKVQWDAGIMTLYVDDAADHALDTTLDIGNTQVSGLSYVGSGGSGTALGAEKIYLDDIRIKNDDGSQDATCWTAHNFYQVSGVAPATWGVFPQIGLTGNMWVVDGECGSDNALILMDSAGTVKDTVVPAWTSDTIGCKSPYYGAQDSTGKFYVSNGGREVVYFDTDGTPLSYLVGTNGGQAGCLGPGGCGSFKFSAGVCVDQDDNAYATDYTGSPHHAIVRKYEVGTHDVLWTTTVTSSTYFKQIAYSQSYGDNGAIYCISPAGSSNSYPGNSTVYILDASDGSVVNTFQAHSAQNSDEGLAISQNGDVVLSSNYSCPVTIKLYSPDGVLKGTILQDDNCDPVSQVAGLAFDSSNGLWAGGTGDGNTESVAYFPCGAFATATPTPSPTPEASTPTGLTITAQDNTAATFYLEFSPGADTVSTKIYRDGVLNQSVPGTSAVVRDNPVNVEVSFTAKGVDADGNESSASAPATGTITTGPGN